MEGGYSRRRSRSGNRLDRSSHIPRAQAGIPIPSELGRHCNLGRQNYTNQIRITDVIVAPDKNYGFASLESEKFNPCALNLRGTDIFVEHQHPGCMLKRDFTALLQINFDHISGRILGETGNTHNVERHPKQMNFDQPFSERAMKTNWGTPLHLMKEL